MRLPPFHFLEANYFKISFPLLSKQELNTLPARAFQNLADACANKGKLARNILPVILFVGILALVIRWACHYFKSVEMPQAPQAAPLPTQLSPMAAQYLQWFKEVTPKNPDASRKSIARNHDILMEASIRYGQRIQRWASECSVQLTYEDPLYKDLQEQFVHYIYTAFLPQEKAEQQACFARASEAFSADLNNVIEPFFTSPEHEAEVRMLLLKKQRQPLPLAKRVVEALSNLSNKVDAKEMEQLKQAVQAGDEPGVIHLLTQLTRAYNQECLQRLKVKLGKIVGPEKAEALLANGSCVSTPIRLGLQMITPNEEKYILKRAKEIKQQHDLAELGLDKLRLLLLQNFPVSAKTVETHLGIKNLEKLPHELRDRFRAMLNRAAVHAELSNKGVLKRGRSEEIQVLTALGLTTPEAHVEHEKQVRVVLDLHFRELLANNLEELPVAHFHDQLQAMAFNEKMQRMNIPENRWENLKQAIAGFRGLQKLLLTTYKPEKGIQTLPVNPEFLARFPKKGKLLAQGKDELYATAAEKMAESFFEAYKNELLPLLDLPTATFKQELSKLFKAYVQAPTTEEYFKESNFEQVYESEVAFYRHFLGPETQVVEYSQGEEGKGTILGKGVCRAKTFLVAEQLLKNPEKPLTDLGIDSITPAQRVMQATYSQNFHRVRKEGENHTLMPKRILDKHRLVEKDTFSGDSVDSLIAHLKEFLKTHEAVSVEMHSPDGSHIIYIRHEKEPNRVIFYDSNHFGAENKTAGFAWLEQGLRLLMASDWSTAYLFKVKELTKKQSPQPVAN